MKLALILIFLALEGFFYLCCFGCAATPAGGAKVTAAAPQVAPLVASGILPPGQPFATVPAVFVSQVAVGSKLVVIRHPSFPVTNIVLTYTDPNGWGFCGLTTSTDLVNWTVLDCHAEEYSNAFIAPNDWVQARCFRAFCSTNQL